MVAGTRGSVETKTSPEGSSEMATLTGMMNKRAWIFTGSLVPVAVLLGLLGWAMVKSGGNPGGLGVNSSFGEVRVSQAPARDFSLELLDGGLVSAYPSNVMGPG